MYEKTTLSNGLRVLTTHAPHARSVSISIFIGVGSRYEINELQGISHFVEHMLFKGTEQRPTAKDISIAIERLGGIINAETSKEATVYWAKVATRHWITALEVLSDVLMRSKFEPTEIEKERRVIIEELSMLVDSPQEWVHVLADEVLWSGHPLGRDCGGTSESVSTLSRDQMLEFLRSHYLPDVTVVSVAGPLDHAEVVREVETRLDNWRPGTIPNYLPVPEKINGSRIRLKSKKTEQAHFCLAVPASSYVHPDRYVLDLINVILGEGMSSRLFLEVRERLGLTYDVHSYLNRYRDTGSAVIYAGVDPSKIDQALGAVIDEIVRLPDGIEEDELVRAKDYWRGRLELRFEDTRSLASWVGSQELLLNHVVGIDDAMVALDRVTMEDVQRVARDVFDPQRARLAIIGPFRKEEAFLKRLGA